MPILNIAHRGFSGKYPQNTLIAFQKAAELGVDYIELDVSLSRDDHVIVFHDSEVSRLTNGTGYIRDLTLDQIRQLDAGVKFGKEFQGTKIPTLAEVIEVVRNDDTKLCIEIKAGKTDKTNGVEEIVVQLLRQYDYLDRVMFTSFNRQVVKNLAQMCPGVWLGFDPSPEESQSCSANYIINLCQECDATVLCFEHSLLREELTDLAHSIGLQVYAWTANDAESMDRLVRMGVDGILTGRPDILKQVLGQ